MTGYSPFALRPIRRPSGRPPRLDLIETCWRFVGPSNRVIECGIYRTDAGLELRAGYGKGPDEDLLRSHVVIEIAAAREIASEWRMALVGKGFEEVQEKHQA